MCAGLDMSMSAAGNSGEEARGAQAADWLVRLQAANLDEGDALAFDAWLAADPANGPAYDAALAVLIEVEASAPRIEEALRAARPRRSAAWRRGWLAAGGLAAAATVAIALTPFGLLAPAVQTFATAQTFSTGKGEH